MLSVLFFIYFYGKCHYAECRVVGHLGQDESFYAECHYAECYYAECRAVVPLDKMKVCTSDEHSSFLPSCVTARFVMTQLFFL